MLLVLKPLAFILLAIEECIYAIALALAFHIGTLIAVAILVSGFAFALGLAPHHLATILPAVFRRASAQCYFLGAHK